MLTHAKATQRTMFITLCIVGAFVILSSTMSKNPVLKPYAESLGTPEGFWIGFVASASTIPGILVSLPAASLSDIVGRRRILLASAAVFASAPFLYILVSTWWHLVLIRFYHGFATATFVPIAEATTAELFPSKRGERISLFSSATAVGRGIAPFLGGYILFATDYSYHTLYLAVAVCGVTAFITTLLFLVEGRRSSARPSRGKVSFEKIVDASKTVARNRGILVASLVQASQYYAYGAVEYFLVGYLKDVVHVDALAIGIIMGSQTGTVILTRPLMGRLSDRIGRRAPIVAGSVASGLPLLLISFTTQFPALLILSMVYGFGFAIVTSSTPALVSDLAPEGGLGTAMGFLDMVMDVGQTIGPIVTGLIIATNLGYTGSFSALTFVLALFCMLFLLSRLAKKSVDEPSAMSSRRVSIAYLNVHWHGSCS